MGKGDKPFKKINKDSGRDGVGRKKLVKVCGRGSGLLDGRNTRQMGEEKMGKKRNGKPVWKKV